MFEPAKSLPVVKSTSFDERVYDEATAKKMSCTSKGGLDQYMKCHKIA